MIVRRLLLGLFLAVSLLASGPTHATSRELLTVSTTTNGVQLILALDRRTYPRDALVRATVTVRNVGSHPILTRIGDGCTGTNPSIEVLDRRDRVLDQLPAIVFERAGGCRRALGEPFRPGQVVVTHVFAVLRGPRLRAVLAVGRNLQRRDVSTSLAVHVTPMNGPTVTAVGSGEPSFRIHRPPGASGSPMYAGSALCGTASDPETTALDLIWSAVMSPLHSGCYQTREWHGLVGYLNYSVARVDWPSVQ